MPSSAVGCTLYTSPSGVEPRLPTELVIVLLQTIAWDILAHATVLCDFLQSGSREITEPVRRSNQLLFRATMVCKTWHYLASPLLYANPFLVGRLSIQQFARTVYRNPDFAKLVEAIYVGDGYIGNNVHVLPDTRVALCSILDICRPQSVFLVLGNNARHTVLSSKLFYKHAKQLRRLTIFRYNHPDTSSRVRTPYPLAIPHEHIRMSHLEVLCLRGTYLGFINYFPQFSLPRLQTLMLYQCTGDPEDGLIIQILNLPSLKKLGLYQNRLVVLLDEFGVQKMRTIDFIGPLELETFSGWAQTNIWDSPVEHLSLGCFWEISEYQDIRRWSLPRGLRSLTLGVKFGNGGYPSTTFVSIYSWLESVLGRLRDLQKLTVNLIFADKTKTSITSEGTDKIKALCRRHGIHFEVFGLSEFSVICSK